MSVSSEIERIQGAKADIKAAIEAKEVTVGAGLYDPLFIPFLRSIDQTVAWNEIIVEEAEPVS